MSCDDGHKLHRYNRGPPEPREGNGIYRPTSLASRIYGKRDFKGKSRSIKACRGSVDYECKGYIKDQVI